MTQKVVMRSTCCTIWLYFAEPPFTYLHILLNFHRHYEACEYKTCLIRRDHHSAMVFSIYYDACSVKAHGLKHVLMERNLPVLVHAILTN